MNFETLIVGFFDNIGNFPFDLAAKIVLLFFVLFWVMVSGWVFLDARERSQSKGFQILSFIFVLVFNIPGLLIYMIIRPKATIQEQYWADLEKRYLLYETADLFDCPKCGYPLQPGFVNCPNCAEVVKIKCECGVNIDKYWKHCPFCGRANNKAITYKEMNMPSKKVNEKENKVATQKGLNSVFKQTQLKLAALKLKLGQKKQKVVVEKKTKKAKSKK
ncbi:MAG TPA: zinc ribbon domain-containing protein [Candidatus Dojkabacteria bacterium]|nr:zinc ribbon domain-containing protein [Candidatus Dojkabacteria bacterium]